MVRVEQLPEPTVGVSASSELAYIERLYAEMGKIARLEIPGRSLNNILGRLRPWQWERSDQAEQSGIVMQREIPKSLGSLGLLGMMDGRRSFQRTTDLISVHVPYVIGDDLRCVLAIQGTILGSELLIQEEALNADDAISRKFIKEKQQFNNDEPVEANGITITGKQAVTLSMYSEFSGFEDIASALGVSSSTISRLLTSLSRTLAIDPPKKDPCKLDLIMFGISAGLVRIQGDELKSRGSFEFLKPERRQFIADWFSPDNTERAIARSANSNTAGSIWFRIMDELGLKTRKDVLFLAIEEGIVTVPDRDYYLQQARR